MRAQTRLLTPKWFTRTYIREDLIGAEASHRCDISPLLHSSCQNSSGVLLFYSGEGRLTCVCLPVLVPVRACVRACACASAFAPLLQDAAKVATIRVLNSTRWFQPLKVSGCFLWFPLLVPLVFHRESTVNLRPLTGGSGEV